ncbi:MAG: hypothetical protein QM737_15875 [Ferruginibacter sp.]
MISRFSRNMTSHFIILFYCIGIGTAGLILLMSLTSNKSKDKDGRKKNNTGHW